MTAPTKPSAPRSRKTLGRDNQSINDACAQRRLQKNQQKHEAPSARGAQANASTHAGTGGCRSPTTAPVVNIQLKKPPSAHSAEATCKSCNKELDPNNRWRLDKFRAFGTWPGSCFACKQASRVAASLAAIPPRLKALEAMVAALKRALSPQLVTP